MAGTTRGGGARSPLTIAERPLGTAIPRIIHQTFKTHALPDVFQANVERIKALNPGWRHVLYDDADIERFIEREYDAAVLARYRSIDPRYGAARADLFRYLLGYACGGVYLDIKSTTVVPLNESLQPDDRYLLSHWRNRPGEPRENWGVFHEIAEVERGEYQQWHVICAPGHPYLKAVIERVLANILAYRAWRDRLGQHATIRVAGPIAYTRAIHPILDRHPHRLVDDERDLGLEYSILPDFQHAKLFDSHYVRAERPMVASTGLVRLGTQFYLGARALRDRLRRAAPSSLLRGWGEFRQRRRD